MEDEKIEVAHEKKDSLKKYLDEMFDRVEEQEKLLKELQERFIKQKKEIRKWLSWMG